jgi:hypothetical protein
MEVDLFFEIDSEPKYADGNIEEQLIHIVEIFDLQTGWKLKSNFTIKLSNPEREIQKKLIASDEDKLKKDHADFEKLYSKGDTNNFIKPFEKMPIPEIQECIRVERNIKYCDLQFRADKTSLYGRFKKKPFNIVV